MATTPEPEARGQIVSFDLPQEIISLILLHTDLPTLVRCRLISKTFRTLIDETMSLQYKMELGAHGLIDNNRPDERGQLPSSAESSSTKLSYLRRYIRDRDSFSWLSSDLQSCSLDFEPVAQGSAEWSIIVQGVHVQYFADQGPGSTSRTTSGFLVRSLSRNTQDRVRQWELDFPVQDEYEMLDFAIDPSQDLLVVLTTLAREHYKTSATVHLVSLSKGSPYPCNPSKEEPTSMFEVPIPEALRTEPSITDIRVKIFYNSLAIALIPSDNQMEISVLISQWGEGFRSYKSIFLPHTSAIIAYDFIDPEVLVTASYNAFPHVEPEAAVFGDGNIDSGVDDFVAHLTVYDIRHEPTRKWAFSLPPARYLSEYVDIGLLSSDVPLCPTGMANEGMRTEYESANRSSFVPNLEDRLLAVRYHFEEHPLGVTPSGLHDFMVIFFEARTLLQHIEHSPWHGNDHIIPWETWSPGRVRLIPDLYLPQPPSSFRFNGSRVIAHHAPTPNEPPTWVMLDFNQRAYRRAGWEPVKIPPRTTEGPMYNDPIPTSGKEKKAGEWTPFPVQPCLSWNRYMYPHRENPTILQCLIAALPIHEDVEEVLMQAEGLVCGMHSLDYYSFNMAAVEPQ